MGKFNLGTGFWIFLSVIAICAVVIYEFPTIEKILSGSEIGNVDVGNGSGYTPVSQSSCIYYNIAQEYTKLFNQSNINLLRIACINGGGTWTAQSDQMGCSLPTTVTIDCNTNNVRTLGAFCSLMKATWWCDNNRHYVGCTCDITPPYSQDTGDQDSEEEEQPEYTCDWQTNTYGGQCAGTCPEGQTCQFNVVLTGEYCSCQGYTTGKIGTIFVSSGKWSGAFGDLSGGDEKCQNLANYAGLPGTWYILASDTTTSVINRLPDTSFYTMNGDLVANNKADLFDGSISHAIDRDENNLLTSGIYVWTGSLQSGTTIGDLMSNCHNWGWVSSGYLGVVGNSGATNSGWISMTVPQDCVAPEHLYCVRVA